MGLLLPTATHLIPGKAGWRLELRRYGPGAAGDGVGRRPIVLVPGYAMNAHILAYHPGGPSLVEHLVRDGRDVWTANLRGQGGSVGPASPDPWGMAELALEDLPTVFAAVRDATGAATLDAIGCSLGASLVFAWLAHHPNDHGLADVVAMGGPLRWDDVHPLLKVAFRSSRVARALHIKGTREMARYALPILQRVPALLSIYMNPDGIDLDAVDNLVPTVEDPVPRLNGQLARWIRQGDLVVRGVNVTQALPSVQGIRALALWANRDGIVPPASARALVDVLGTSRATALPVGTDQRWYAHADLFIGRWCRDDVFVPLTTWLDGGAP